MADIKYLDKAGLGTVKSIMDSLYASKGHNHDTVYSKLGHNHNDIYYTEGEIDTKLAGKSNTGHSHNEIGNGALVHMCSLSATATYNAYKITTNWDKSWNIMPTINIRGYAYGSEQTIDCDIVIYHYNNAACNYSITNKGSYDIKVYQAIENNVQVFYINPGEYYGMFNVFAYSGLSTSLLSGWTMEAVDAIAGTEIPKKAIATNITGNAATATYATTAGSSSTATNAINDSDGNTINSTYLKKSGGALTGSLTFANGTWNIVGDDAAIGDYNSAGMLGLKSVNNNIPGIGFHNSAGTLLGSLKCDAGILKWNTNTILDSGNSSVSKSGETLTVNINGTSCSLTNTNTWRGITNSYSGTSTDTSLSQKGANDLYNSLISNRLKNEPYYMTTNPFGNTQLHINYLSNAMYAADKRYTVSLSNISGSASILFNGEYEGGCSISAGQTGIITIDRGNKFEGFSYGDLYVSFYYTSVPESVTCRVYCTYSVHGVGWHDLTPDKLVNSSYQVYKFNNGYHDISKFEFTIKAKSGNSAIVTQIDYCLNRGCTTQMPVITKFSENTLYHKLTAPEFVGNLTGNVTGNCSGSAGSVAWTDVTGKPQTFSPSSHNHNYVISPYYYSQNVMTNTISSKTLFGEDATINKLSCGFMENHPTWSNYADVLYFTGYCKWGGTQIATQYNASKPRVAIRKFVQDSSKTDGGVWGNWIEFITSENIANQSVSYATSAGSAPASDVYSWAKAANKPSYTFSEINSDIIIGTDSAGAYIEGKSNKGLRLQYYRDSTNYDQLALQDGLCKINREIQAPKIKLGGGVTLNYSSSSLGVTTSGGSSYFGAMNTSYCHIYTDLPAFYMNKSLYINGSLVSLTGHNHTKSEITDFPSSLPANGGNADTVGGKSASDFATSTHSHSNYMENYISVNNKNMNAIKTPGVYYGYNMSNAGVTDISNFIILNYSNDWGTQLQFSAGSSRAFCRFWQNAGGVMQSNWKEFSFAGHGTHISSGAQIWAGVKTFSSAPVFSAGFSSSANVTITGSVTASQGFFDTSDERLKDFYDDIDVDFDKLKAIPKKYFSWKNDENKEIHLGTSAQEIQKVYPEIVNESADGELSVDYSKLSVVALAAVDKLYNKINKIEQVLIDKGIL